jgi:hypothetical protein
MRDGRRDAVGFSVAVWVRGLMEVLRLYFRWTDGGERLRGARGQVVMELCAARALAPRETSRHCPQLSHT